MLPWKGMHIDVLLHFGDFLLMVFAQLHGHSLSSISDWDNKISLVNNKMKLIA